MDLRSGTAGDAQEATDAGDARADAMRLLKVARDGDKSAFGELAGAYRAELRAHCYRITGSLPDAEDALQEGLLRAWRGLAGFEARGSVRAWLYAIVTNAAFDLTRNRTRRELPIAFHPNVGSGADVGPPLSERPWPDTYSDHWPAGDALLSPEAQYEQREDVELAVLIAMHHLPPLPRTVLLLREVVGFSTAEIASQLGTSPQSVNSALQRARAAVRSGLPAGNPQSVRRALGDEGMRTIVQRYANAIERGDSDALVGMLTRDVLPCQLPALGTHFAGRAAELTVLDELLDEADDGEPLVVSISGPAGVGKTALAVHWAHRVADRFGDGQLYLNLHGFGPWGEPVSAECAIRSLLDALRLPRGRALAGPEVQAGLYGSVLAGRRVLIVLDNARDAVHVRPLLPGSGGYVAVVTSRGRLPGFVAAQGARALWLDVLSRADARSLLVARLGGSRLDASTATDELIELCAQLPLALTVTAARLAEQPSLPLSSVVAQLRDKRHKLDALDTSEPASGVRSVFWYSYRALTGPAARLFRLLSVHPGPDVTVPAAASLAGVPEAAARRALGELTQSGLLAEHAPGRFCSHDLLRAYAAELASAHDRDADRRAALGRVLDYYLHASAALGQLIDPSREQIHLLPANEKVPAVGAATPGESLAWFDAELPVLTAAISQAARDGFDAHSWQLAWAIEYVLAHSGRWQAIADACRTALQAACRLGDRAGQAQALRGLGRARAITATHTGSSSDRAVEEGVGYLERAVDLLEQLGDGAAHARAHLHLAAVVSSAGRYGDAIRHAERALDLFRTAQHKAGQADALNDIGWYHIALGNHQRALAWTKRAVAASRQAGDLRGEAYALDSLAVANQRLGNYARAVGDGRSALSLVRQLHDVRAQAEVLMNLGDAYHQLGDESAARDSWTQALGSFEELGCARANQVRARLDELDRDRVAVGD